jgi:hypothetical protein
VGGKGGKEGVAGAFEREVGIPPTYYRRNHSAWKSFRSVCTHTVTHMYICRYMHTCTRTHTHALIRICMRVLQLPTGEGMDTFL